MAKKKELDNISLCMIQCEKDGYGCHYGHWQAARNRPVVIEKKDVIPDGYKLCPVCGNPFKPNRRTHIYCGPSCQMKAHIERNKEKYQEYYKKKMAKRREAQRKAKAMNCQHCDASGFCTKYSNDAVVWKCKEDADCKGYVEGEVE